MQPKRFSELDKITDANGEEIIPIVKDGENKAITADNLPTSSGTQAAINLKANEADLLAHTTNTSNPHSVTKNQVGLGNVPNIDTTAAVADAHTHTNKSILDATTASFTTAEESKLSGVEAGSQVNGFIPTPVKSGSYNAAPRDFVPTDASVADVTVVLPDAPADRTRIAVKMVKQTASFATIINVSGADKINIIGGGTSLRLTLLNHGAMMQYKADDKIWYVEADDLPLSQLDTRYGLRYMAATNNGVVANDGTDQTLNIKTFLQAAQAAGAIAYFPPGTYKSSWFYVGAVSIFAIPGTVKIVATQTNDSWNFGPTTLGASVLLTADAAAGSNVLTVVSTSGVSAGDVIQVGDTTTLVGWNTSGNSLSTPAANLYRVQSVNTGTSQITLSEPLIYAMRTANNAYFQTTGMTDANGSQTGFSITGLHFECQGGSTSTASFMRLWNLRNVFVDVTANGFTNAGLIIQNCYQFKVNARVTNFSDVAVTGTTGQFGYGVDISGSSAHGDVNVNAHRCRHAISFVGTGHNIRVTGVSAGCTSGAWDAHAGFTNVEFHGCTSVGDTAGFNIRGNRQRVIGGMVDNATTYGVFIFDNPQDCTVKGVTITNSALEGIHVAAPNSNSSGITIADCQIRNCATAGIDFTNGGVFTDVQITNTTIRNVQAGPGIKLNRAVTRGRLRGIIVEDNQGPITTTAGIDVGVAQSDVTVDIEVRNGIPITSGSQAGTITLYGQSLAFTPTSFYYNTATTSRTDSSGVTVTSGSPTVLDSNIVATDTGRLVTGTGIPSNTYIGTVTPGVSFLLSSSPMTQTNVNATNNGTSITLTTYQFVIPTNCTKLFVYCFGAGGGGGSGALEPVSTTAGGGSGGAGGGWSVLPMLVSEIASQPVAIAIGAGGIGANGQTTNSTVGIAGTGGGASSFGNYVIANGGAAGGGGTTSGGSASTGGSAMYTGGSGQNSSTSTGQSANTGVGASGGGSGGTLTSGNASTVGGSGTFSLVSKFTAAGGAGAGGVAGAINGGNGASPATAPANGVPGFGGGGGGAATPSSGNGGGGATGSVNGGGGGGGGGANNGNTSGTGGNGGPGAVYIIAL